MEKFKSDIYSQLLWTLIGLIVLMGGGMITYVINRNSKDIEIVQKLNDIKLDVKDLHYMNNDIYQNKIIPAYNMSKQNDIEICLLKKNMHKTDSLFQVTNRNVIRIFDWVRKNKGLSFAD